MTTIQIDFKNKVGAVKPMHAVNNGPIKPDPNFNNVEVYAALKIPFARNHDASYCMEYGGGVGVDGNHRYAA